MHLVAIWAKDGEVLNGVVLSFSIKVRNFENLRNAEAAVCADWRVALKSQLPVVDSRRHGYEDPQRLRQPEGGARRAQRTRRRSLRAEE